jgi:hypothetical protein
VDNKGFLFLADIEGEEIGLDQASSKSVESKSKSASEPTLRKNFGWELRPFCDASEPRTMSMQHTVSELIYLRLL